MAQARGGEALFNEVIRNREERMLLKATTCSKCSSFFSKVRPCWNLCALMPQSYVDPSPPVVIETKCSMTHTHRRRRVCSEDLETVAQVCASAARDTDISARRLRLLRDSGRLEVWARLRRVAGMAPTEIAEQHNVMCRIHHDTCDVRCTARLGCTKYWGLLRAWVCLVGCISLVGKHSHRYRPAVPDADPLR